MLVKCFYTLDSEKERDGYCLSYVRCPHLWFPLGLFCFWCSVARVLEKHDLGNVSSMLLCWLDKLNCVMTGMLETDLATNSMSWKHWSKVALKQGMVAYAYNLNSQEGEDGGWTEIWVDFQASLEHIMNSRPAQWQCEVSCLKKLLWAKHCSLFSLCIFSCPSSVPQSGWKP